MECVSYCCSCCDLGRWCRPAGQPFREIRYATLLLSKHSIRSLQSKFRPPNSDKMRKKRLTLLLLSDAPEPPSSALRFVPCSIVACASNCSDGVILAVVWRLSARATVADEYYPPPQLAVGCPLAFLGICRRIDRPDRGSTICRA